MSMEQEHQVTAAVRDITKGKSHFRHLSALNYVAFDFEQPETFDAALTGVDTVFLLRPPHIANVDKHIKPLLYKAKQLGVNEVVFLSVQGAERSKVIPHNKIERLIADLQFNYIFLRPSYFMQNLTTTLLPDIQHKRCIVLPAGNARFNWIAVENIAEIAATLLMRFDEYKNRAIELTGYENESFYEVAQLISKHANQPVVYKNVNPLRYFWIKRREGVPVGKVLVMIMLHFLPRFQQDPVISEFYEQITGHRPTTLNNFIERNKSLFTC